jgi:hypothetical protein
VRLAGHFTPTEELYRDAASAQEINARLFDRTQAAGAIRPDIDVNDSPPNWEEICGRWDA